MDQTPLLRLALALLAGLLVGLERGWAQRASSDGRRVAGLRTFGLVGLLGGVCGLLSGTLGGWLPAAGLAALAWLLCRAAPEKHEAGLTTEIAALTTFGLGVLAGRGHDKEAAAAAAVVAALLGFKPRLHQWVKSLSRGELEAGLKFLFISVVVLPNLPDRGYGPWDSLNPYHIWWMVVLIAALSFAGYLSVLLLGQKGGIAATSVLGGLVSSTAVTLSMARLDKRQPGAYRLHAAGIVVASSVMFPRVLLEVGAMNAALLPKLLPALCTMAVVGFVGAWLLARGIDAGGAGEPPALKNPLELGSALFFGGLLAVVTMASKGLQLGVGDKGVYIVALTAGLMDVDAVTLSLSKMAKEGLDPSSAANGILLACAANTAAKTVLAAAVSQWRLGLLAASVLVSSLVAGAAVLLLT